MTIAVGGNQRERCSGAGGIDGDQATVGPAFHAGNVGDSLRLGDRARFAEEEFRHVVHAFPRADVGARRGGGGRKPRHRGLAAEECVAGGGKQHEGQHQRCDRFARRAVVPRGVLATVGAVAGLLREHQHEEVGDENGARVDDEEGEGHEFSLQEQEIHGNGQDHQHEVEGRVDRLRVGDHARGAGDGDEGQEHVHPEGGIDRGVVRDGGVAGHGAEDEPDGGQAADRQGSSERRGARFHHQVQHHGTQCGGGVEEVRVHGCGSGVRARRPGSGEEVG